MFRNRNHSKGRLFVHTIRFGDAGPIFIIRVTESHDGSDDGGLTLAEKVDPLIKILQDNPDVRLHAIIADMKVR